MAWQLWVEIMKYRKHMIPSDSSAMDELGGGDVA